ncbi:unnamed protein product [Absidia cylindrospora]
MVKSKKNNQTLATPRQEPFSPKEKLVLSKTLGGNISQSPLEFTKDSKYFFLGVGTAIKIYSIATGAVVKVLSRPSTEGSHKDKVTCVLLNPKNPLQLLSASLDGTIKLWDYNDEVLLKTFMVDLPIKQFVLFPSNPEHAYLLVSSVSQKKKKKDDVAIASSTRVYQYHLDTSTITTAKKTDKNNRNQSRMVAELPDCHMIALSTDASFLAMATRHNFYIWPTNHSESDVFSTQLQSYTVKEGITQIAFHPTSTYVAVGYHTGQIVFYHCLTEETKTTPVTERHHWHSTPVRSLKFMDDGNYLLSGGDESVLVVWQLGTGFRRYFPRIGGEINYISITPDYKHFCLSLGDNSIRMINAVTQTVEQVIQGVQQWDARQQQLQLQEQRQDSVIASSNNLVWSQGMMVEPRNHHLVLNGAPGLLQFYDSKVDHHALELEIIPNNRNTRPITITSAIGQSTSSNTNIDRGHIAHLAFSPNGEWMATVDMRDDQITTVEVYLKFWQWDHDQQTYVLHTRVDRPHNNAITSLCFHPSSSFPMAITTSMDKSFKVWHLSSQSETATILESDQVPWTCRSIGVYRNFWPSASAFSADGSMLTVAFGPVVTVWDPYQNTIQGVLSTPEIDSIKSLHFINDSPYLVSRSKSHLFVWNLLTCTVWWSYQIPTRYVSVDPRADRFMVVVKDDHNKISQLVLFEPTSPQPLLVQALNFVCQGVAWLPATQDGYHGTNTIDQSDGKQNSVTSRATFVSSDLAYLQPNHTIKIMSVVNASKVDVESDHQANIATPLPLADERTLFNDAYGSRQQQKAKDAHVLQSRIHANSLVRDDAVRGKRSNKRDHHEYQTGDILNGPSHILPRVDVIFESYMATLMAPRSSDSLDENNDDYDMDAIKAEQHTITTTSHSTNSMSITSNIDSSMTSTPNDISTLDPLPSLEAYFATLGVDAASSSLPTMSSGGLSSSDADGDESDDDDDIENIDW